MIMHLRTAIVSLLFVPALLHVLGRGARGGGSAGAPAKYHDHAAGPGPRLGWIEQQTA